MKTVAGRMLILLAALCWLPWGTVAQDEENVAQAVEEAIICPCPDCPVKLLSTCFCGKAEQTKDEIRAMASQGMTKDQIVASFVEQYGERVLAKPEERGFNLVGYWFPTAALLLGGLVVVLFIRRAVRRGKAPAGATGEPGHAAREAQQEPADEYEERLRREIKSLS